MTSKKIKINKNKEINIIALIPCYNEDINGVKNNIDNLLDQNFYNNKIKLDIFVICDGLKKNKNNDILFEKLILEYQIEKKNNEEIKYNSFPKKNNNKLIIYKTKKNNTNIYISYKETNSGKKDSLIIGEKFINKLNKYNYIYHTDADTITEKNCIINLLNTLEQNHDIDGCSGLLKIKYNWKKEEKYIKNLFKYLFSMMQEYQYYYSIIIKRFFLSNFKQTLCLPGCCNLIRVNQKTLNAIHHYEDILDENNYVQLITTMQGTDKKYTSCLLKERVKLTFNIYAFCYTEPPSNHKKFINQRRRWASNTFFNSLEILNMKNIKFIVKLYSIINIFNIYLSIIKFMIFLIYIYKLYTNFYGFLNSFITLPIGYDLFILILFLLPVLFSHIFGFLFIKKYRITFFSFIINIFFFWMSIIYNYIILKMLYTSTNFSWGKLKKKNENIEQRNIEIIIQ